jgi:hypothetical protein
MMAAVLPDSRGEALGRDAASEVFAPIARLLGGIWSVESVQKVKLSTEGGQVDLWVLMREDILEDEGRIALMEREYRIAVKPTAFELHVFPLTEVDEAVLPPAETIFER